MVSLTVKVPASWLRLLRIRAAEHGRTIADDILDAYESHPTEPLKTATYWQGAPPRPEPKPKARKR